jgi:hypothetical protein
MTDPNQKSRDLGFTDGQGCGAHLLTTYDSSKLIELLGDPSLKSDEAFYLGFLKTEEEIKRKNLDFKSYLDGFHEGYRDALGLDSENLDIGGGG